MTPLARISDPNWAEVVAATYGRTIHDMQDIAQIVRTKYWLQQCRGTIRQDSAYLRQVIRRTIIDQVRSTARQPISREIMDYDRPLTRGVRTDPADSCGTLAERLDLDMMIEQLPHKQRDVVRRRLNGESVRDIAGTDRVPEETVRRRWSRAVQALRQRLGE